MVKSSSDIYKSMFIGVALFVGGMVALILIERYLKTGYFLPPGNGDGSTTIITDTPLPIETPVDTGISQTIQKQQKAGSLSTRSYTVNSAVKMLWNRREGGLQWTSVDFVNNGPDPVYISVNTSDFPLASLPVGQTLNVDLKQHGAIDKVYLRCDQGKTANVDLWVVK